LLGAKRLERMKVAALIVLIPAALLGGCGTSDQTTASPDPVAPVTTKAHNDNPRQVQIGDTTDDQRLTFRVDGIHRTQQLRTSYSTIHPKPGRFFVRVDLTYRNDSQRPIDYLCEVTAGDQGAELQDREGRTFGPNDATFDAPANDEGCGDEVQPGTTEDATIMFEVPNGTTPTGVRLWNPSVDADPGVFVSIYG
jgi:hypothetical protein